MARRKKVKAARKASRPWKLPRLSVMLRWILAPVVALFTKVNARSIRRSVAALSWTGACAAVIAGWILGVPRLQALASRENFSPNVRVRFIDPPRWFNGDLAAHLIQTAEINLTGDPHDRNNLVDCRETLLATGWFESIRQITRTSSDLVEIDAQFARPYTVIRDADGDHLVDVIGRLLPLRYERGARTSFTAIAGAHFARPQYCGEVWEGTDIIAGLRLLQLAETQPWKSQIVEVDVSGYVRGEPIKLKTDAGTTIVWGGAPGEEPALEVLAEGKIKRLEHLYRTYGRIDAGEGAGELDITNEKAVVAR